MKEFAVRFSAGVCLFCLAALLGFNAPAGTLAGEPAKGQSAGAVAKSAADDSPVAETLSAGAESSDPAADELLVDEEELARQRAEIDTRYAEVYRKIAELNLQSALDANRHVPNTVAAAEVDRLRQIVRLAEVQSKAADAGEASNDQSMTIENDASQVKMTQEALRRTIAANNRAPGVVPRIELDRLRLLAELSRLQLAKDKIAAEEKKAAGELRKRVVQLEKQVKDLAAAVERLSQRAPAVSAQTTSLAPVRSSTTSNANKP